MTASAGATSAATRYPYVAANLSARGRWFYNGGVGGETSAQIKTRLFAADANYLAATSIIWAGRNDFSLPNNVKSNIAEMVAALGHSRYLVLSITTSSDDSGGPGGAIDVINTLNADLLAVYGVRFLNVLAVLQAANDGSANDLADVAAGYVPRSLRSDAAHLNDAGYAVVAGAVYAALVSFGW